MIQCTYLYTHSPTLNIVIIITEKKGHLDNTSIQREGQTKCILPLDNAEMKGERVG